MDSDLEKLYAPDDAKRLATTLHLLTKHDLSGWALTGGTAIELHLQERGGVGCLRPLHDLDFIAASFDCLPSSLGDVLLSRHVHPHDPPGKTMLQAVDPVTAVRVDVFRAYGNEIDRAQAIVFAGAELQMVAFEDLVARHARLCCSLLRGHTIAPKYARDLVRMLEFAEPPIIESIWPEHRKPDDPESFSEVVGRLRETIVSRPDLLVPSNYSTDVAAHCPRCESTKAFRLADAEQVFAILGYC